jgi:hypothetical protein
MWPLIGGIVSGGASLLGSMFSSDTSAKNTQAQIAAQQQNQMETERFNAEQVGQQENFQQQMSNSAYTRASADMKNAGLNPMMMFGSGGAASTPSGSSASVGTPQVPMPQTTSPLAGLGDAVGKAVNTAISAKTFEKMTEEIANIRTDSARMVAGTALTEQSTKTEEMETEKRAAEGVLTKYKIPGARVSAREAGAVEALPNWLRDIASQTGYLSDKGSKTADLIGSLVNSARRGVPSFNDRFHY